MKTLSSTATPFTKFVLPGFFWLTLPVWIYLPHRIPSMGFFAPIFWGGACALLTWWAAPIKKVSLDEHYFAIGNYRREILVPISSFLKIREDRFNKTPNISLFFDPPTEFGRKIRLIPLHEIWSRREFDRISALLRNLVEKNRS